MSPFKCQEPTPSSLLVLLARCHCSRSHRRASCVHVCYRITSLCLSVFLSRSRSLLPRRGGRGHAGKALWLLHLFTFVPSINFCQPQLLSSFLPREESEIAERSGERSKGGSCGEGLWLARILTVVFRHLICYKVNVGALSMAKAPQQNRGAQRSPHAARFGPASSIYRLLD